MTSLRLFLNLVDESQPSLTDAPLLGDWHTGMDILVQQRMNEQQTIDNSIYRYFISINPSENQVTSEQIFKSREAWKREVYRLRGEVDKEDSIANNTVAREFYMETLDYVYAMNLIKDETEQRISDYV